MIITRKKNKKQKNHIKRDRSCVWPSDRPAIHPHPLIHRNLSVFQCYTRPPACRRLMKPLNDFYTIICVHLNVWATRLWTINRWWEWEAGKYIYILIIFNSFTLFSSSFFSTALQLYSYTYVSSVSYFSSKLYVVYASFCLFMLPSSLLAIREFFHSSTHSFVTRLVRGFQFRFN